MKLFTVATKEEGYYSLLKQTALEKGFLLKNDQIKNVLSKADVDLNKSIISTCGSGVSACVLGLALEIMGKNNWKIYDGSWTEWGRRKDTPIEI